ncbi:hypothetical protein SAMD00023353_0102300 [Rosellinia necatrix]|uniref:Uncharacterized protein n=1 Tax=Rosellinia necatrix TaxID=77044 RepID=A0A1S7UK42_ROSNE|nr:hypothetical protein SAMD00023353_0102300 [Rosellinia necatrix]
MDHSLDGQQPSCEQLCVEAAALSGQLDGDPGPRRASNLQAQKPSSACEWQGDAPDPELDDLAHPQEDERPLSRLAEACDWVGDEIEEIQDDIDRACQLGSQSRRPNQHASPSASDKNPGKHAPEPSSEPTIGDEKGPRRTKARAGDIANSGNASSRERRAANESPANGKTHSPWVDALDQMPSPAAMLGKVKMDIKQTLEAASNILTPSGHKEAQSPDPAVAGNARSSSLAPVSAAAPPDFGKSGERSGAGKKESREARRQARLEKKIERRQKRKEDKERQQKEKEWKKISKKGGEIAGQLLQGLRPAHDSTVPYDPRCGICAKSAASVTSNTKRDPKCTTCTKIAERESTKQYVKSSKINLAGLPSPEDFLASINTFIHKEIKKVENIDEDLVQHMALHVRGLAVNGGEADLVGHECNTKGQPGHVGCHGLDGNGDSPTTTEAGQITSELNRNSDLSAISTLSEVDWWAQAVSSRESPQSPYRSSPPPRAITPFPR